MATPKNFGQARGLDAIFRTAGAAAQSNERDVVKKIRITEIEPRKEQPRRKFDEESLAQLAESIRSNGVIQPILARKLPNGFYQIIAGERRWRASKLAGLNEVPVVVIEADEKKVSEIALIENIQREDLNAIEEAAAYRSLMNDYGLTQEELSKRVGKSRSAIANSTRLLELPDAVADLIVEGKLSAGHARALLGLARADDMERAADTVIQRGLSVRATEALVKAMNSEAARAEREKALALVPEPIKVDYSADLEKRVEDVIGRSVRIVSRGKDKKLEISFSSNEDLEELLKMICGDEFFDDV
ncbi:MAG: ParB/RepB/Spo0J family partition protein [Clostridia bacterium]|nr:ParB/RepB/Spo0J family partition protein [Clostridia bacterium]